MGELLQDIETVVGPGGVLTGGDVAARPAAWLRHDPMVAKAIVRPRTTAEVSKVLGRCHAEGQTVVALGGNTNLVDSTLTNDDDILLSMERMTAIETIDTVGATMTVQASRIAAERDRATDDGDRTDDRMKPAQWNDLRHLPTPVMRRRDARSRRRC